MNSSYMKLSVRPGQEVTAQQPHLTLHNVWGVLLHICDSQLLLNLASAANSRSGSYSLNINEVKTNVMDLNRLSTD